MNKVRFLKVSSPYLSFVNNIYKNEPQLRAASYQSQIDALCKGFFAWGDGWKIYLEETQRYEVEELIMNAEPLQKRWAKEHHFEYDKQRWMYDILEAQIADFKPSILFALSQDISSEYRLYLRQKFPGIKFVIGYDGTCNHDPLFFRGCDMILSCLEYSADFYNRNGYEGYFFKHAFDPRILDYIKQRHSLYDAAFIGSIKVTRRGHNERLNLLSRLTDKVDMDLWLSDIPSKRNLLLASASFLKRRQYRSLYTCIRSFRRIPFMISKNKGAIFGLDMYQALADSRVTFNCHIDLAGSFAANMRMFETTGVGTCLLTDWKSNLKDYFEIGKEVVAYRNADECIDKMKYLLSNETFRKTVALNGQKKTLEQHNLKDRILEFEQKLIQLI